MDLQGQIPSFKFAKTFLVTLEDLESDQQKRKEDKQANHSTIYSTTQKLEIDICTTPSDWRHGLNLMANQLPKQS